MLLALFPVQPQHVFTRRGFSVGFDNRWQRAAGLNGIQVGQARPIFGGQHHGGRKRRESEIGRGKGIAAQKPAAVLQQFADEIKFGLKNLA